MMMMGVQQATGASRNRWLRVAAPLIMSSSSQSSSSSRPLLFIFIGMLMFSSHAWAAKPSSSGNNRVSSVDSSADALISFKKSLVTGPNGMTASRALASWDPSTSPCSGNNQNWRGVLCYNGNIWGLQLENLNLSGDIDVDSLTPLRSLRTLSFMNNAFEGVMPDWRKLGALKSLFLSNNHFSGEIPDNAFSSMTSLKKIHLANNNFVGNIPLSLAITPRLLELRLENNDFTGTIPAFHPGLRLFNVSNNQLEGQIPPSLSLMDPSTFSGNKDLCGKPLDTRCNPKSTSPAPTPHPTSPGGSNGGSRNNPAQSSSQNSTLLLIILCCMAFVVLLLVIIILLYNFRCQSRGGVESAYSPYNAHPENFTAVTTSPEVVLPAVPSAYTTNPTTAPAKATPGVGKLTFVKGDRSQFDLQDLLKASAEVLGSGNLGSSYKALMMDGQAVVVKRFKHMNYVGREDFHEHMRRLGRLEHPNLLPLVAYYYRREEKLLVVDHIPNGSLASHLYGTDSRLDWRTRLKIIKGVAKGLAYLQTELPSLVTYHGHLKSSNVLLDKSFNPIMMDYTLGPVVNCDQIPNVLIAYKSPEYALQGRTTRKTDVWTLGILILETLTGRFPANYLMQCPGYGSELASWIECIAAGLEDSDAGGQSDTTVFDKEMGDTQANRGEMQKLLKIGLACCQEDLDKRWELKEVLEELKRIKDQDDD
ncbi:PREDICTED: pollen receptor-like kinase 1 [Ipomoea nil]|uniref:pollen receptor-like kinase 1 n=1 Tax=Ipomoea nil TaxID=35883 RepID=UPI000900FCE2|nr:PREDICTED: pollen receptor-like kinase 1 [Ipomoea nil]